MTDTIRQLITGLRALVALTVLLGIGYPVLVWGIAQTAFPDAADGSLVSRNGTVVGSARIGQRFEGDRWFAPRPSANDYDALASGGTNLGPSEADLVGAIAQRRAEIARRDGVPAAAVPPDALTASASGLDPYISPAYADQQIDRVARARHLSPDRVRALVEAQTRGRILGFLGEPRVDVLQLNLAVDATQ